MDWKKFLKPTKYTFIIFIYLALSVHLLLSDILLGVTSSEFFMYDVYFGLTLSEFFMMVFWLLILPYFFACMINSLIQKSKSSSNLKVKETFSSILFTLLITLFIIFLTYHIASCGGSFISICLPYALILYMTKFGIISWPATLIIAHLIVSRLMVFQIKKFSNHGILFTLVIILLFVFIGSIISLYISPELLVKIIPLKTVCNFTSNIETKDQCFRSLANIKDDKKICSFISSFTSKQACYDDLRGK